MNYFPIVLKMYKLLRVNVKRFVVFGYNQKYNIFNSLKNNNKIENILFVHNQKEPVCNNDCNYFMLK